MKRIELNTTIYGFAKNFKHDQKTRESFNRLTASVYGFSLENWYQSGLWGDYYVPYALLHNNEVVSNVSINRIEFEINGERKKGIQIGTVMTADTYRNRGLNRYLMQQVMHDWKDQADFVYLFANDTVLDFYPKFNFEVVAEYQHTKTIDAHKGSSSWKKLDMDNPSDAGFLTERIQDAAPMAKISMRNNTSLLLFYCNSFKKNSIYYIKELDAIVIADFEGDTMYLDDLFAKNPIEINSVIHSIADNRVQRVVLGFTPLDVSGFEQHLLKGPDTLFMLKDTFDFFTKEHWMFPVLSHA